VRFNIAKLGQAIPTRFTFIRPVTFDTVNFSDSTSIAEAAEKLRSREEKAGGKLGAVEAVRRVMGETLDFSDAASIARAALAFQELESRVGRNISASDAVRKVIERK
jgi:hypothetical protein